ncbi:hypothetical protein AJ87_35525 [Rhizobium yanglingense]|nr:hypothetical protein AJ87_35525 [Rhizobium yanglingense]
MPRSQEIFPSRSAFSSCVYGPDAIWSGSDSPLWSLRQVTFGSPQLSGLPPSARWLRRLRSPTRPVHQGLSFACAEERAGSSAKVCAGLDAADDHDFLVTLRALVGLHVRCRIIGSLQNSLQRRALDSCSFTDVKNGYHSQPPEIRNKMKATLSATRILIATCSKE